MHLAVGQIVALHVAAGVLASGAGKGDLIPAVSGVPHHLHLVPVLQGCNGRTAGDGGPVIRRFR